MPTVKMTPHLYRFFPALENRVITAPAGPIADILRSINQLAPGFTDYILDERGALRRHVNLCINDNIIIDRQTLTEHVPEDSTVFIFQALSGG
ncbi:MAG: hypothetical protein WC782_16605 [Methylococcaceae bacterium]|jgi:hypothetical protein